MEGEQTEHKILWEEVLCLQAQSREVSVRGPDSPVLEKNISERLHISFVEHHPGNPEPAHVVVAGSG